MRVITDFYQFCEKSESAWIVLVFFTTLYVASHILGTNLITDVCIFFLILFQIPHNGETGVNGEAVLLLVTKEQNKEVELAMVLDVLATIKSQLHVLLQRVQVCTLQYWK